jgi:hypothetical protein
VWLCVRIRSSATRNLSLDAARSAGSAGSDVELALEGVLLMAVGYGRVTGVFANVASVSTSMLFPAYVKEAATWNVTGRLSHDMDTLCLTH